MAWTERQQAMLRAMGLPVGRAAPEAAPAPAPVAAPAPVRAQPPVAAPPKPAAPAPVRVREPAPMPAVVAAAPMPAPMPAPIGTADWAGLRDAVAACRACGLCEGVRQPVFGVGHAQAHWLIVGDLLGEAEDQRAEPFVGEAGQLLDNMLRALGLGRQDGAPEHQVFLTTSMKCREPAQRKPTAEEVASCRPWLQRQIELLQPRVVLALGRPAALALLGGDAPLGRLRGQVHQAHGVPVVVTFPPEYLLRHAGEKARAWDDLRLAASVVKPALRASSAS